MLPVVGVTGQIVPLEGAIWFQGRFEGMGGPFVFVLTNPEMELDSGQIWSAEGVLLAAVSGPPASAYPILAVRSDTPVETGVFDKDHFNDNEFLRNVLEKMFKNGIVSWK